MGTERMDAVYLRPVSIADAPHLYLLLKERPKEANISHKRMPHFWAHCAFILSEPYRAWYLIKRGREKLGSVYLTDHNEIGLFIRKSHQGQGIGRDALSLLMQAHPLPEYLANIAPANHPSRLFFLKQGFKPIQVTYALEAKTV